MSDVDTQDSAEEGLAAYELQRQQLIARNRARLIALGIPDAVSGLAALAPRPKAPRARGPKRPRHEAPEQPSRQSVRVLHKEMEARGEVPPDVEPDSELGRFIVDGECPKCGRVISVGHRQHLERCKGRPAAPPPPTEEEIVEQAEKMKSVEKARLRQLELGGLVDFGDDEAVFIVIGSTGNHYVVRLSDDQRKCTCIDHRIRKRDCKHIKLILQQLGVADQPLGSYDWRGGVQRISEQLDTAAEQDIEMVHQADARRAIAAAKRSKKQSGTKAAGAEPSGEATSGAGAEQQQEEQEEGKAGRAAKGRSSRSSNASKAPSSKATKKGAKEASAAGLNTSRSRVSTRTTRRAGA